MKHHPLLVFTTLLVLWIWAMMPYMFWFVEGISTHYDLLHAVIAVGVLAVWFKSQTFRIQLPRLYQNNLALGLGGAAALLFLFLKNQGNIRILTFTAGAGVLYCLLSLVIAPTQWRKGLLPYTILLMTLPFGRHLDILVGFPLRMMAVDTAYFALEPFYPDLQTASSILIIENRASHVDMDCSGLRGLWAGLIFFFVITWVERASLNLRWGTALLTLISGLVFGNIVRIVALVFVQLSSDLQHIDPLIHHSTSIFFLLTSCFAAFLIVRNKEHDVHSKSYASNTSLPLKTYPVLYVFVLLMALVPRFEAEPPAVDSSQMIAQISDEGWQTMALTKAESKQFEKEGVQALKFEMDSVQMMLILDGDWRSQHIPEICYELGGLSLSASSTLLLDAEFPIRNLSFQGRQEQAYYWFQCNDEVTDDFASKFWQQVFQYDKPWSQVSILARDGKIPSAEINQIHHLLKSIQ